MATKWLKEGSEAYWSAIGRRDYRTGWMAASLKTGRILLGDDVVY
jgi:MOSC domain-containing protein YiiM